MEQKKPISGGLLIDIKDCHQWAVFGCEILLSVYRVALGIYYGNAIAQDLLSPSLISRLIVMRSFDLLRSAEMARIATLSTSHCAAVRCRTRVWRIV